MAESSYTNKNVIEASRNFVNVVAHEEVGHGSTEVLIGREKVKLCNEYHTISCEVHVKARSAVGKFFQGTIGLPATVFAEPGGKELTKKTGSMGAGELVKAMNSALAEVKGEKIPLALWNQAQQTVAAGQAAMEKKDFRKAVLAYTALSKMKGRTFKDITEEYLAKVVAAGEDEIKEAAALPEAAAKKKALQKIADDFKGTEISEKAKKELDALK